MIKTTDKQVWKENITFESFAYQIDGEEWFTKNHDHNIGESMKSWKYVLFGWHKLDGY